MSETQAVFPLEYKPLTSETKQVVLKRDNYTCQKCLKKSTGRKLDVHHKVAIRKGGTHNLDNLMTLCRTCHRLIEPIKSLKYAYKVTNYTLIAIDKITNNNLVLLADIETRNKIDELRFLVKERAKELGVKFK